MAEKSTHDGGPRTPGAIIAGREGANTEPPAFLSNAEIADRLASLAQLLSAQKENPYKVKAYQRAAAKLRNMSESLQELVQDEADLTQYAGIGDAIASAIREIVQTGSLRKLETLRAQATPAMASINAHPRLDPKRVQRIYKKLAISSVQELREKLDSGEIERVLGLRMAQHVWQGITETHAMLLYRADDLRTAVLRIAPGAISCSRVRLYCSAYGNFGWYVVLKPYIGCVRRAFWGLRKLGNTKESMPKNGGRNRSTPNSSTGS
jgi:hypothetical protein